LRPGEGAAQPTDDGLGFGGFADFGGQTLPGRRDTHNAGDNSLGNSIGPNCGPTKVFTVHVSECNSGDKTQQQSLDSANTIQLGGQTVNVMKAPSHGSGPDLSHNVDNDCSDHSRVPQLSFRKLAANPKITKVIPRSVSSTKHSKKYSTSGAGINQ